MTTQARQEPVWIERDVALAIHDRQLAEHGGGVGVRDENAFGSALARPINKWSYEDELVSLAAAYAFGVARNHAFVDGNKRTAWVLARLLLALNGVKLRFTGSEAIEIMLALAAGELSEEEMAEWFRRHQG
ncbi:MAG: type II toxin-antitoxin system death-on-curing family toxin [Alphaproteobacteria bacterium]|nr:type II toxin-antitoxin system death-on-curing family toxin [Alphaproteobacteria bacterium]MBV9370748.1 type II toxin-antitoxin system death-on-curing family toxin [Alphaproteobacteria bacterium]MBV9899821.1 type II toxin-antitoxin system death-on-curing family toxin [Alphaproteobacteria bacterium]